VSEYVEYEYEFKNNSDFTMPHKLINKIEYRISYDISGSAEIEGPDGDTVAEIDMSGDSVTLDKYGEYEVSESYKLEIRSGSPDVDSDLRLIEEEIERILEDEKIEENYRASNKWSFDVAVPGTEADFEFSEELDLDVVDFSSNIMARVSGMNLIITVEDDIEPGDSVSVTVSIEWGVDASYSLTEPDVGTIEVNTNLNEASFSIEGPADYDGEGKSWTQENAPVGTYTIEYDHVDGYETPPSESERLDDGDTITFTGEYIPLVGTIAVKTNRSEATFSISGKANYMEANFSFEDFEDHRLWTLSTAPAGDYTIVYGEIDGYETPEPETQTLNGGGNISFIGNYEITPPKINSVSISKSLIKSGDVISLSIAGDPDCDATFSIADVVENVPMPEEYSGMYTAEYTVPEGIDITDVVVTFKLVGTNGGVATHNSNKVTIDTIKPVIRSVSVLGSPANKVGDIINVNLFGDPEGTASFYIENITEEIPMLESSIFPGSYNNSYTVGKKMNVKDAKVVVKLTDAAGNVTVDESKTVSILASPWDVNGDGVVDVSDLEAIGAKMGEDAAPELDVNSDGIINIFDLVMVAMHLGEGE
jgi:hypothetical protein